LSDFIFELISEEIPAKMQKPAMRQLENLTANKVSSSGLNVNTITPFVTPVRLGVMLKSISSDIKDSIKEIRGPRLGAPQSAIEGFLKKNNIKRNQLQEKRTDKGDFYVYAHNVEKKSLSNTLSNIFTEILEEFNWPKSMYWGDNFSLKWVRPLRNIVAVLFEDGNRIRVPVNIRNIESNVSTRGHQVMSPKFFEFKSLPDYQEKILKSKVILQSEDRKKRILEEGKKQARVSGFHLVEDDALLDEIVGLTEFPTPIMGLIPKNLLLIPEEVIVTSMREHQKFVSLRSNETGKVEGFLVVSDIETNDEQKTILTGNTRVLTSRLKDAIFFYQNDLRVVKKHGIKTWIEKLKHVRFHEKLGSQHDRVERIVKLAVLLSKRFELEEDEVRQGATLIKVDLVSELVTELPSLQGVMGAHYAKNMGFDKRISDAIRDHYLPLGPNDPVPKEPLSALLALSDKIDYLTSLWGIGIKPTGNKDPFALRRTSLGIIRIILENDVNIDLGYVIGLTDNNCDTSDLELFLMERIIYYFTEKKLDKKVVKAVVEQYKLNHLPTLPEVIDEVTKFISSQTGASVLSVYKRVSNFLNSNKEALDLKKQISQNYVEEEDKMLQQELISTTENVGRFLQKMDFKSALSGLESLATPVNKFLDNVQVNCDNKALRSFRYLLLNKVKKTMDSIVVLREIDKK
jgi:glycyl-tRNA synthetase beta chain